MMWKEPNITNHRCNTDVCYDAAGQAFSCFIPDKEGEVVFYTHYENAMEIMRSRITYLENVNYDYHEQLCR